MDTSHSSKVAIIVALIIGLVLGAVGAMAMDSDAKESNQVSQTSESQPNPNTKAADLRTNLNVALGEHVDLALAAMRSGVDGDEDFEAVSTALSQDNTQEIATMIGSVYGEDAQTAFTSLWQEHIGFFVDYVTATANNDEAKQQQAVADLEGYAQEFAAFLNGANPDIKPETVIAGAEEHRDLVLKSFDEYVAGDFAQSYTTQQQAYDQIGNLADLIATNVVNQFPDKF